MSFSFESLGHKIAWVAQKIVIGAKALEGILVKVEGQAPIIETITAEINPAAALIERAAFGVLGKVVQTVHDTENLPIDAAGIASVGVTFTAQEIADIKSVIEAFKKHPDLAGDLKK